VHSAVMSKMTGAKERENSKKQVSVELFGYARRLAGEREAVLELDRTATMRDVVIALSKRYPALVGPIIKPNTYELIEPFFLNVDGRRVVDDFSAVPKDGERLILFFVDAGG